MPECGMHDNECTTLEKTEAHYHKPYEACYPDCPYPHWEEDRAEDWFERWNNEKDTKKRAIIEDEGLPPHKRKKGS